MGVATRVTVKLPSLSGLLEDVVENVFHVQDAALEPAGLWPTITARFVAFYNDTPTGGVEGLHHFMSQSLDRGANRAMVTLTEVVLPLGVPQPSPYFTQNFTLAGGTGGIPLPSEIAVVTSFHSVYDVPEHNIGTRPRARRRGRVFVGPLNSLSISAASGTKSVPDGTLIDTLRRATLDLRHSLDIIKPLGVYSRVGATFYSPLVAGWVDNAFDTQRRRGEAPTVRTNFVF